MGLYHVDVQPSELRTILEQTGRTVYTGRAPATAEPPFIVVWRLDPRITGDDLCPDGWGVASSRWQVSCIGTSYEQAQVLRRELIDDSFPWPRGWELALDQFTGGDTVEQSDTAAPPEFRAFFTVELANG